MLYMKSLNKYYGRQPVGIKKKLLFFFLLGEPSSKAKNECLAIGKSTVRER